MKHPPPPPPPSPSSPDGGGGGEGEITDGCDLPDYTLFLTSDGSVLYNSSDAIGGFQFNVDGLVSASGGAAADAGFTVSTGGSTVLGFSFSGASIPAGEGVLTTLTVVGSDPCLSNIVI